MMAFLVVPASALFLDEYGASALPYAYLAVAVAGVGTSSAMSRAQRRLSLSSLAAAVLAVYVVVVAGALAGAHRAPTAPGSPSRSLCSSPCASPSASSWWAAGRPAARRARDEGQLPPCGGGLLGRLRRRGAGSGGARRSPLGGPRNLLAVDVLAAALMPGLVLATSRAFPDGCAPDPERPPAWPVAAAAAGTPRLVGAAAPPDGPADLRLPGALGRRDPAARLHGVGARRRPVSRPDRPRPLPGRLRRGHQHRQRAFVVRGRRLAADPLRDRVRPARQPGRRPASSSCAHADRLRPRESARSCSSCLVCAQQVADIALTDGTTRTSINATYQALLPDERLQAQTLVEGAGVPLALGFVGALLLVYDALGLGIGAVVVMTLLLSPCGLARPCSPSASTASTSASVLSRSAWDAVPAHRRPGIAGLPWRTSSRALTRATSVPAWRRSPTPAAPTFPARSSRWSTTSRRERRLLGVARSGRST